MSTYALLWLPWVAAGSAAAGWLAVLARRREDRLGALRWVGWALVPPALLLTGTIRLVGRVAAETVSWASGLVFSPVTWLGLVVAAVAVAMIGGASALQRRGQGGEMTQQSGRKIARSSREVRRAPADDDMAEIEAILRRRGIS